MIPKLDSNTLNKILIKAQDTVAETSTKIDNIKSDMQQKLMIMKHETEYVNSMFNKLKAGMYTADGAMHAIAEPYSSQYSKYGSVVHSGLIRTPTNVFNLEVAGTGEVFFRDDINVSVNGQVMDRYKDLLKHESLSRTIFFDEFVSPNVILKFETPDISKMLGPTKFNMIEIDPFLNGSFDVTYIRVYKYDSDGGYVELPDVYSFPACGKLRFILPEKISFYKIEIGIKVNYETYRGNTKIYPFGLKHLYFYDADFRTDSYAAIQINSDKSIGSINEAIRIKTPDGVKETTMTEQGMIVYVDYKDGVFETPVPTTTANQINVIAREVNTLYVKIPLYGKSLIGAEFTYDTK